MHTETRLIRLRRKASDLPGAQVDPTDLSRSHDLHDSRKILSLPGPEPGPFAS
jgi:hypothetical protein